MSWKKTLPFFLWQTLRFSRNTSEINHNLSNRTRWLDSFQSSRNSVQDESAWVTFDALDYLTEHLLPTHRIFEYGGGGSTLFFLRRALSVVTVEHHEAWFNTLSQILAKRETHQWEGHYIPSDPIVGWEALDAANPAHYKSLSPDQKGMSFERYVNMITPFQDGYFDWVLIDGRARTSCIRAAIPKVKKEGWLVIDNAERPYYLPASQTQLQQEFRVELDTYAPVPYSPDFSRTLILRKL